MSLQNPILNVDGHQLDDTFVNRDSLMKRKENILSPRGEFYSKYYEDSQNVHWTIKWVKSPCN